MGAEMTVVLMESEIRKAEAEIAKIDSRWKADVRQGTEAKIKHSLAKRLQKLRDEGYEQIKEEREAADVRLRAAKAVRGPAGAEQWTEAAARSGFVAADVARMDAPEVTEAYRAAVAAGDKTGAWLLEREGRKRLEFLKSDTEERQGAEAYKALDELEELAWGKEGKAYNRRTKELNDLYAELARTGSAYVEIPTSIRF